jgi:hypothetical protein
MDNFRNRERAFEAKFAHDEELKFRAIARRNRLIGHWAAQKLGLTGPDAVGYEKAVINADLEKPDSDSVFQKIRADFDAHGVVQSDHQIRRTMDEFLTQTLAELKAGT